MIRMQPRFEKSQLNMRKRKKVCISLKGNPLYERTAHFSRPEIVISDHFSTSSYSEFCFSQRTTFHFVLHDARVILASFLCRTYSY